MLSFRTGIVAYLGVVSALVAILIAAAPAAAKTPPTPQPTIEEAVVPPPVLTPREYLFKTYPEEADLLDAIIRCESNWNPAARNSHSTASGLAQFLASTWKWSREGLGRDQDPSLRFDPIENIDTAVWLLRNYGPTQWECYTKRLL